MISKIMVVGPAKQVPNQDWLRQDPSTLKLEICRTDDKECEGEIAYLGGLLVIPIYRLRSEL